MTIPKLKLLLRDARIKPAVNEMELHPHFQQAASYSISSDPTAWFRSDIARSVRPDGPSETAHPRTLCRPRTR